MRTRGQAHSAEQALELVQARPSPSLNLTCYGKTIWLGRRHTVRSQRQEQMALPLQSG